MTTAATRRALHRLADRAAVAGSTPHDLPSPCVSVCRMAADSGLCEGCLRTLDEIAGWSRMDDAAKRRVWLAIARRAQPALQAFTGSQGD